MIFSIIELNFVHKTFALPTKKIRLKRRKIIYRIDKSELFFNNKKQQSPDCMYGYTLTVYNGIKQTIEAKN